MVGQNVYTEEEIRFILRLLINETKGPEISEAYGKGFGKPLTPNQLRYVKNKYGKDPKYGTTAINKMNKNGKSGNKRKQTDDGAGRDRTHPFPSFEENRAVNEANLFPAFEENRAANEAANQANPFPHFGENKAARDQVNPCFEENNAQQGFGTEPQVIPENIAHGPDNIVWSVPQYPGLPQAHPQMLLYQPLNPQQLSMPTQAAPSHHYHQPPAPKVEPEDYSHAMVQPAMAPVNEPILYQQQGHIPNGGYQMTGTWGTHNPELSSLGGITNFPTMQTSSSTPSVYTPIVNQMPSQNTPQATQSHLSIASPPQMVPSPHNPLPVQVNRPRLVAPTVQQYGQYMANQSTNLLSPPNDVSPVNPQPTIGPYYGSVQQPMQVEAFQKKQQISTQHMMPPPQTNRTQDWNHCPAPQPYTTSKSHQIHPQQQQRQPEPAMFPFGPNIQTLLAETATLTNDPATTTTANPPPNHPMLQASPSFNTTNLTPTSLATAPDVVSTQTSGLKMGHQQNIDDVLTGHFDAADYEFFVHSTPGEYPLEQVSSVTTLHPAFKPHTTQNDTVNLDTIDPKLLNEMYALPPLKMEDTATPPEEGPKTPTVSEKLSVAI
ncbi:hypothetical protein G7Z17_g7528 [Cylindrodendrum hubeiense]|uniref:Uncharacterized protein n=1 Tax=Cylindrodendrum hubeiense TaxID=595255 RepID=A0A9P5H7R1_9HYPO|nr:hypothetical protein G7Z17_g7528 [Cylindrodendrum hubeiense]